MKLFPDFDSMSNESYLTWVEKANSALHCVMYAFVGFVVAAVIFYFKYSDRYFFYAACAAAFLIIDVPFLLVAAYRFWPLYRYIKKSGGRHAKK